MTTKNFCTRSKLNDGRVRLGAIVFLSALGFALFGIVMRVTLMAAPVDVAPTWGKVLIAGGTNSSSYLLSFRPLSVGPKNETFRVFDAIKNQQSQSVQLHGIGQRR